MFSPEIADQEPAYSAVHVEHRAHATVWNAMQVL